MKISYMEDNRLSIADKGLLAVLLMIADEGKRPVLDEAMKYTSSQRSTLNQCLMHITGYGYYLHESKNVVKDGKNMFVESYNVYDKAEYNSSQRHRGRPRKNAQVLVNGKELTDEGGGQNEKGN